tara:strand:+ start:1752 stop:1883 length:132 start_codon:yes stop_codon:yes gene_type:complete
MKDLIKELKELEQYFNLPLWLITVLLWISALGLVILMALVDSM